ncbi:hypothetical protein ONS95_010815 [Cadophora gregata]|uniref:uncharacterized protein n=1 Tax=Cadophora gregata TaxID=51156 RepID=UPI0026DA927F|nr:uncharacterized protein ONS95_010815 [Cadophora gregata]KAK0119363.1 hypothetical protein ONS95_010815 [Cadophora gregata]KAK0120396.1 hypothetical protein ONS96_010612 [Cadophora gregata f. sp. sojae]
MSSLLTLFHAILTGLFSSTSNKTATDTLPTTLSFTGQHILITGATSGLGLEAAIHYVNLGAESVLITARTLVKGNEAKYEIEKRTGKKDVVSVRVLDMDTFEGVVGFMRDLRGRGGVRRADVVLLNAGVHPFSFTLSPNGWEQALQVNVLSTLLLAILMIPWLREIRKPGQKPQHLGFVGSSSHYFPDISKFSKQDVLQSRNREENFVSGMSNYAVSKLLFQYGALEVARLAVGEDGRPSPIINIVCPGMIRTNIARDFANKGFFNKLVAMLFMYIRCNPADVGARSLVLMGITKEEEHGTFRNPMLTREEYDVRSKPVLTSPEGKRMQAQAWKEITGVLVHAVPEVGDIVRL